MSSYYQTFLAAPHEGVSELPPLVEGVILSVIIPVYNEAERIPLIINALRTQSDTRFQVVFVDNGSTDNSTALLRECSQKNLPTIHILSEQLVGPGNARRRGMDAVVRQLSRSQHDAGVHYLVTTDCDATPNQDWIASFTAVQEKGFVGLLSGAHTCEPWVDKEIEEKIGIVGFFHSIALKSVENASNHSERMKLSGPNCAVAASIYAEVGGIEQPLKDDGSCGINEMELFARKCRAKGYHTVHTGYLLATSRRRNFYELIHGVNDSYVKSETGRFLTIRESEKDLLDRALKLPVEAWMEYREKVFKKINDGYQSNL